MRQSKGYPGYSQGMQDKVVPSVVTVSQLDKAPEIYRTTQKDTGKEKTALVRTRIFSSNRRKPSATWQFYL